MVYILSPYSIDTNTTSVNRIKAFQKALLSSNIEATIISPKFPSYLTRLSVSSTESNGNGKFIKLDVKLDVWRRLVLPNLPAILNKAFSKFYYLLKRKDILDYSLSLSKHFEVLGLKNTDVIIASGPPFSIFRSAYYLKCKYGCKLIVDYRDPWTTSYVSVDGSKMSHQIKLLTEKRIEEEILSSADLITAVSKSIFRSYSNAQLKNLHVIGNGANLEYINTDLIIDQFSTFKIGYLGTIYNEQLKDLTFFEGVHTLIKNKNIDPQTLQILFVGAGKNTALLKLLKRYDLTEYVKIFPRLEMQLCMELMYDVNALLHLKYEEGKDILTSKNADYLALQKPILLPVSDHGLIAQSVLENNAGYISDNLDEFYKNLEFLWENFISQKPFKIQRSKEFLYEIGRDFESSKMVELTKKMLQIN